MIVRTVLAGLRPPQPLGMAEATVDALALDDDALAGDVEDSGHNVDLLQSLRRKHSDVVLKQVEKLHDQLGHPINLKLMAALKVGGAAQALVSCL